MKEHSEERVRTAVRLLLQTLERNITDTGIILDEYEETHDEAECFKSRQYAALLVGHCALKEAIDRINNELNKK